MQVLTKVERNLELHRLNNIMNINKSKLRSEQVKLQELRHREATATVISNQERLVQRLQQEVDSTQREIVAKQQ